VNAESSSGLPSEKKALYGLLKEIEEITERTRTSVLTSVIGAFLIAGMLAYGLYNLGWSSDEVQSSQQKIVSLAQEKSTLEQQVSQLKEENLALGNAIQIANQRLKPVAQSAEKVSEAFSGGSNWPAFEEKSKTLFPNGTPTTTVEMMQDNLKAAQDALAIKISPSATPSPSTNG
jgi:cell division protein FtsB